MFRKIIFLVILFLATITLSGCSLRSQDSKVSNENNNIESSSESDNINNKNNVDIAETEKVNTEIKSIELSEDNIYKVENIEESNINSLQSFISSARELVKERITQEELKSLDFSYNGDFFSYEALFTGLEIDNNNNSPAFLVVDYNLIPEEITLFGDEAIDSKEKNNNLLISYSCHNEEFCTRVTTESFKLPEINSSQIKITQERLLEITSRYEYNESPPIPIYGQISWFAGDLYGRFGKYKFNLLDGSIIEEVFYLQSPLSYSDFPDVDLDGLNAQEEKEYGTNDNLEDSDGDGYSDGSEIINGYNPIGEGRIKILSYADRFKNEVEELSSRDKQTIEEVEQIQDALELYYNSEGKYPENLSVGSTISSGGNIYLSSFPEGIKAESERCLQYDMYKYNYMGSEDHYLLTYCLDNNDDEWGLKKGMNQVSPNK